MRLFIDMDGVLGEYNISADESDLFKKGYFLNVKPVWDIISAIEMIHRKHKNIEIFILSSVLDENPYAKDEKNVWLDKYLSYIDSEHRIYPSCSQQKSEYIPGGVKYDDVLLDDYTKNLMDWPGIGIKLINGINGKSGIWKGEKISICNPKEFAYNLLNTIEFERRKKYEKISQARCVDSCNNYNDCNVRLR